MSIEVIRSIKQAEAEADQIAKQSAVDARKIISDAQNTSAQILAQVENATEESVKSIFEEAEKAAQGEITGIKDRIDRECAAIRKQAGANTGKAVDIIVGRIVRPYGDC